jgi:pilus assembly protein CpaF
VHDVPALSPAGVSLEDLVANGTLPALVAEFLADCVRVRASVLVSGGTGSGKTTTLNALSGAIPDGERIVTVEDAAELRLQQEHVVRLEARPPNIEGRGEVTIRALVRNALRMRRDRMVVGEVRGERRCGSDYVLRRCWLGRAFSVGGERARRASPRGRPASAT